MGTSRDMFNAAPQMMDAIEKIAEIALEGFRGDRDESEALCDINNLARATLAKANGKRPTDEACAGGIDPGFGECPKCGATMDDECRADIKPSDKT